MESFEEDLILGNKSLINNETETHTLYWPTIYYIWHALSIVTYLTGCACDSLIIHAIVTNPQMRSRTNKIILNWAVCDFAYLVLTLLMETYLIYINTFGNSVLSECILWHVDIILRFLVFMFIAALMSNSLIRSKRVTDEAILWILWAIAVGLMVVNTNLCVMYKFMDVIYVVTILLSLIMLIVIICKEINACRKKRRSNPNSDRTKYRMTIAAIYIYNWYFSWFFAAISEIFHRYVLNYLNILYLSGSLSSLYVLIYMASADRHFKIYIDGLFGRSYDADTIVTFSEYCAEDDGVDDPEIGVTVGDDGKVVKRLRE